MSDVGPNDEARIGLRHYLAVLRRRKWIVLGVVVLAVGVSSLLTLLEQSTYRAETTIVVGQGRGLFNPGNGNSIQPFSATMKELIKSTVVARDVISDLGLKLSPAQLLDKVSVSFNPESAALDVSVLDHLPARAEAIAADIGTRFTSLITQRFVHGVPNVQGSAPVRAFIWDPAHVVPGRVSPTPAKNLIIAGALGLLLGLLAAFLRDHFDRSLRTIDEIEEAFGVPVIGQIPTIKKRGKESPQMVWGENGEFAESFRALRANLQYLAVQRPLRTILVTSPGAEQGKTTVCANLGTALAQSGASVVLLEADLRRPRLAEAFGLPPSRPGLTSVLIGNTQLGNATHEIALVESSANGPDARPVTLLPSGPLPPNPSDLVSSPRMRRLVDGLAELFDTLLIDSAPLLLVADSLGLARLVDGVIVVVRAKTAIRDDANEVRALVERLEIPLVGVVVNDVAVRGRYGAYGSYVSDPPDGAAPDEATVDHLTAGSDNGGTPFAETVASSDS